jgi:type VI secretion system secreted protein Hcp
MGRQFGQFRRDPLQRGPRERRPSEATGAALALQRAIGNRAAAGLFDGARRTLARAPRSGVVLTMEGEKQGKIKGDVTRQGDEGKIDVRQFNVSFRSPRDAATGQATGKRQHQAVRFSKTPDGATPLLMTALISNEKLTRVVFEFSRAGTAGAWELYQRITLTDAYVTAVDQEHPDRGAGGGADALEDLERVELVYGKIEIQNVQAKTAVVDEWVEPK